MKKIDPKLRFWTKTKQADNGCLEWTGNTNQKGYGLFSIWTGSISAHRFAYQLAIGEIPDGMLVLHRCDNPRCVRPSHLFIGSYLDNVKDCIAKGRLRKALGEDHGCAKMTEKKVRAARNLRNSNPAVWTIRKLAARYGVSYHPMRMIVNHMAWRHVV